MPSKLMNAIQTIKDAILPAASSAASSNIITLTPPYGIEGPDISTYQEYNQYGQYAGIDYAQIAQNRKSVRLVGIKLGEGSWEGYPIDVYKRQLEGFLSAGIECVFPYHYWHVEIPTSQQVTYYQARLKAAGRGIGPLAVDIEDTDRLEYRPPKTAMTAAEIKSRTPTALAMATALRNYLDGVSQIEGRPPLWYGADWYESWFLWLAAMAGMDMGWVQLYWRWIASYTSPLIYLPFLCKIEKVLLWQDTSTPTATRQMLGFPWAARVDCNWFLRSEADFYTLMLYKEPPLPQPSWAEAIDQWAREDPARPYQGPKP